MDPAFAETMKNGYALTEPAIVLGSPMLGAELLPDVRVQVALAMLNRHGLIAGATGTGKTKTLQLLAGQLSDAGVPVFISDIKGDVTGIAAAGNATDQRVLDRAASLNWTFKPKAHPAEFLSLSGKLGAQVRATVHSFGPLLLGKVLGLNETQTSILSLVFKYCDDSSLPLLDLADLRTTLNYLGSDEGKDILATYGGMSPATLGVILRSIVNLEQQGADTFFGEPEFDVADLMRFAPDGTGIVSVLELSDVMDKPVLFSTFMLWMLAQLYHAAAGGGRPAQAEALLLLRRGAPAVRRCLGSAPRRDRADGQADPLQGRRRLLLHPDTDRRAGVRARAARQPLRARAQGIHAAGRRRPPQDRAHVSDDNLLQG